MATNNKEEKVIRAENSQKLADIELCFKRLYSKKNQNLLLPTSLRGRTIGTSAALIQFIYTWTRVSKDGKLVTYVTNKKDSLDQLDNFCNEFHGLVALQMLSGQDVVDRKNEFSLKTAANITANRKIEEFVDYSEFKKNYNQRNKGVMLVCFDQTICEYPDYFYEKDKASLKFRIRDESEFITMIKAILKITSTVELSQIKNTYESKGKKDIHEDLGSITKELIENTESWAKKMYDSNKSYYPNTRGLIIQFHTLDLPKREDILSDPLNNYINNINEIIRLNNETTTSKHKKRVGFFELSIFDSGPGLARRWEEVNYDQLSIQQEYNAVLDCFKQNMTSDLSGNSTLRGFGLPKVLQIIGKTGFIRIRSGRLSLYRDFNQENLIEDEIEKKTFQFQDWNSRQFNKPEEMPVAEGTLLSIIYPFSY